VFAVQTCTDLHQAQDHDLAEGAPGSAGCRDPDSLAMARAALALVSDALARDPRTWLRAPVSANPHAAVGRRPGRPRSDCPTRPERAEPQATSCTSGSTPPCPARPQ
jgi:hypothetical protein